MPIVKIPVVQKFGILSTKYHQELQKILLERNKESHGEKFSSHRSPLEVTEEFIKQFNAAEELEVQEHMLDSARKILHRCKRRSGINCKGSKYVNLHLAWEELVLMAQCKGKIQEEALDILILSMDQADLNQDHIPLLFFIAESVLYRICCDSVQKPHLYSSEIKLSKLGLLSFLRLYTFHLLGKLQHFEEQKDRLYIYLKALPACEASYESYPNILLSVHIMLKVGEAICDLEIDLETNHLLKKQPVSIDQSSMHPREAEISPFLWHCLLIWQHIENNSTHLHDIIQHLFRLKGHLHRENWLDSLLALFILGEAAKKEIFCLQALMDLGGDVLSHVPQIEVQSSSHGWHWEVICVYTMVLAGVCLHGSTSDIQKYAFIGFKSKDPLTMSNKEASLNSLLLCTTPDLSDANHLWMISYCAVYNLVKICHELKWDTNRDGLRIAIWNALYKHKSMENDTRVFDAEKIAEAEVNGPANPFINTSAKTPSAPDSLSFFQYVGCRLARALSQQFLPTVVHSVPTPRKASWSHVTKKGSHIKEYSMQKKASRPSLRQELMFDKPSPPSPLYFITRTSMDLQKVMKDQWEKELKITMDKEEEETKQEQLEQKKREEERFKEIMKKREEKLKKTSKPYELP
ncbi:transmembrane protein 232 isoform X1 [Aquarana catesbeiana]|uniref:transmembrane protein 232 isoform X1 n=1 Tax=Aquarana catesbeiana TaxID=8400 RepID=UPI003CC9A201